MNGFLLIDKPKGITSFYALKQLNRRFRIQENAGKLGHGGTLDPAASGLLVIAIGKATKLLRFFLGSDKRYTAAIEFGTRTSSDDCEGEVIATAPYDHVDRAKIEAVLKSRFHGEVTQVPPDFSAVHIDGKRAYKLARQGREIEMPERTIQIYETNVVACELPGSPRLVLDIACSGGAYIRAIARDLGHALGSEAHLAELRRTESCQFSIKNAHTLDYLMEQKSLEPMLFSCEQAMASFQCIYPSQRSIMKLIKGIPANFNIAQDGIYPILTKEHVLVAVLERREGKNEYLRLMTPDELVQARHEAQKKEALGAPLNTEKEN